MTKEEQPRTIPLRKSRWILLGIWFGGTALILFPVIVMCFTRAEIQNSAPKIVGWLLPNLIPTLSLIATIVGADAIDPKPDKFTVRVGFHRFVMVMSIVYIAMVAFTFLIEPLIANMDLLDAIDISNLWLGPIQGFVAGVVSILFYSTRIEKTDDDKEDKKEESTKPDDADDK